MRNFLKQSTFALPDGESLAIRELSAGGRRALIDVTQGKKGDAFLMAAITVRAGCPEFAELSPEEVLDLMPAELLNEIAGAVLRLSGIAMDSEAQAEKN